MNDEMEAKHQRDNLLAVLGDESAVNFCMSLWDIIQIWDDLYDGDKEVSKEKINNIFTYLLVDLPYNPFFAQNRARLMPMLEALVLQWRAANKIEEKPEDVSDGLNKAYMLRGFYYQIVHYCGLILGGWGAAEKLSNVFQNLYGERFYDYKKEFEVK